MIPLILGCPHGTRPMKPLGNSMWRLAYSPFLSNVSSFAQDRDYPLPEALLQAKEIHFDQLAKAGTAREARQALGLGHRPTQMNATALGDEAGPYRHVKTRAKEKNIVSLVDHMAVMGVKPLPACFKLVAEYTETSWRQVRKIHHERRREVIKLHEDLSPLPRHGVRPDVAVAGQHGRRL